MKYIVPVIAFVISVSNSLAQSSNIAALNEKLRRAGTDTARSMILAELGYFYRLINPDSGIALSTRGLTLARENAFVAGEASALNSLAQNYRIKGDLVATMPPLLEALRLGKEKGLRPQLAEAYLSMGNTYVSLKDYPTAIGYMKKSIELYQQLNIPFRKSIAIANMGEAYLLMGNIDSARLLLDSARQFMEGVGYTTGLNFYQTRMAQLMFRAGKYDSAYDHIQEAEKLAIRERNLRTRMMVAQLKAEYFWLKNQPDSSIYHSEKAFELARQFKYKWDILASVNKLAELHKGRNLEKAYHYTEMSRSLNDSLYGPDVVNQLQREIILDREQTQTREAGLLALKNRVRQTVLLAFLLVAGLVLFWLYRVRQKDRRMNFLLKAQKEEISTQKAQVEQALHELKATQAQLIQTEKMASLGELTAGIAHEIQNPLNFVNNFSEVSRDLLQELNEEMAAGQPDVVKNITMDLDANLEKIHHHGKRAEAIVKSMLQHSRSSSGIAEPIDLNQLCDECVQLSYQSFKSRQTGFDSKIETSYDHSIGLITIISADISRVLINLLNNAMYAVHERALREGDTYTSLVKLTTENTGHEVNIQVEDNADGIPSRQLHKVFQPFFTTKAPGQGTGLGLSISFDIVKAHHGHLEVASDVGKGSIFTVRLPRR